MPIKVACLVGKAGSGKDAILNKILELNNKYNRIIHTTTRPMRENEVNGLDYDFISGDRFVELVRTNRMAEFKQFNDWSYGTTTSSLKKGVINIGTFTPKGVVDLAMKNIKVFPIYILANDKTRMLRQLNREEIPDVKEIARRFLADEEDFSGVNPAVFVYNEEGSDLNEIAQEVMSKINTWAKSGK